MLLNADKKNDARISRKEYAVKDGNAMADIVGPWFEFYRLKWHEKVKKNIKLSISWIQTTKKNYLCMGGAWAVVDYKEGGGRIVIVYVAKNLPNFEGARNALTLQLYL